MYLDFEFADKRLSDFGCITCIINQNSSASEFDIGCDITFNTIKNSQSSIHYQTSTSYDNIFSKPFEIMKNPCNKNSEDEMYMTTDEISSLMRWLNRREYRKFKPLSHDGTSDVYYYGSFNVKQIMIGDKTIGLSLIFTANAPYGFGERVKLEYDITSPGEHFYIHGDGDEMGVLYPNVSITCKQNTEELTITNLTTGNIVSIRNCLEGETIYINGEHKIIMSDNEEHTTICNDFDYTYLDILVEDDDCSENEYIVSAPCSITIDYSHIRKVGV